MAGCKGDDNIFKFGCQRLFFRLNSVFCLPHLWVCIVDCKKNAKLISLPLCNRLQWLLDLIFAETVTHSLIIKGNYGKSNNNGMQFSLSWFFGGLEPTVWNMKSQSYHFILILIANKWVVKFRPSWHLGENAKERTAAEWLSHFEQFHRGTGPGNECKGVEI